MSIVNSNNFLHKTVDGVKQFFSPLVNAATVVRKNGTRLEQDGVINVDKLGGVDASDYMVKSNIELIESPFTVPSDSPAWVTWVTFSANTLYRILEWTVPKTGKYMLFINYTLNIRSQADPAAYDLYIFVNKEFNAVKDVPADYDSFWQQNVWQVAEGRWPVGCIAVMNLTAGDHVWIGTVSENVSRETRLINPENTNALYIGG